jgi:hypothetical protein
VTPLRVVAGLAIAASLGLLLYGLVRRDQAQIPILSAGLVILGLTLLGTGFWSALGAHRNARAGRSRPAFAGALFGGVCVLAGSAALTWAVVLALLWESA